MAFPILSMVLFAGICDENVIVSKAAGAADVNFLTLVQRFGYHNYQERNMPYHYYVSLVCPIDFYKNDNRPIEQLPCNRVFPRLRRIQGD